MRAWDLWRHWRQRSRRDRAIDAVATLGAPRRILVLCDGNVCRSPFAAALLHAHPGAATIAVSSAGLAGGVWRPPARVVSAALRRRVSLAAHEPRVVTHADIAAADLIVVMEERHQRVVHYGFGAWWRRVVLLGDFDPLPTPDRAIADPMAGATADLESCYARIERCVATLAGTFGAAAPRMPPA